MNVHRLKCSEYGTSLRRRRSGRPIGTTQAAVSQVSTGRPTGTAQAAGFQVGAGRPTGTTQAAGFQVGTGRPEGTTQAAGFHVGTEGGRPACWEQQHIVFDGCELPSKWDVFEDTHNLTDEIMQQCEKGIKQQHTYD